MTTTTTTANKWEEAWGEYMEALALMDDARKAMLRRARGNTRTWDKAKTQAGKARKRLEKMDPEFMARLEQGR
jgi:hypothetical protein